MNVQGYRRRQHLERAGLNVNGPFYRAAVGTVETPKIDLWPVYDEINKQIRDVFAEAKANPDGKTAQELNAFFKLLTLDGPR